VTTADAGLEGIARHGKERPGALALVLGPERRTYGDLDDRTNRLAHVLRDAGAHPGTTVAAVLPNGFGRDYEDQIAAVPSDAADLASAASWTPVFYTSGTTGLPKGVIHGQFTPEKVRMGQEEQRLLWSWEPEDVHILSGPAYHAGPGGWTMTALSSSDTYLK